MSVITHSINEIVVGQRAVDGYINATAMCQACGKQLAHYLENQTTKAFLEALSENIGIPILNLAEVKRGRNGGTWVHPQVAINLGQWCSPQFAVLVSKWIYEWMRENKPPVAVQSIPSQRERLENIRLGLDLFQQLGGCDPRTEMLLKDHIRNILVEEKLQPTLPGRVEWPVSDRAVVLGHRPTPAQLRRIGKEAARIYQQRHGEKPVQREQFVGGTTRMVNVYSEADVDVLDEAIALAMANIQQ
ncbi:MAG: KilA-N domain-containing protein [Gloeocapsa sp. UFS-A4-WI-NPMV-4B04]|jgi:hypothetical protein|nr:KilA-N domain-containing protein [Gloeocapsa sp. UFS-A4-WI-NPMV-4B04]